MLLGGILLKIGTYGYIVLIDYVFDEIFILCSISMIKNSLEIAREVDIKKVIAYSSIVHMGMCMVGLSCNNKEGILGGILMSLGHGWISCGLFKVIGELQVRYGIRSTVYLRMFKERSSRNIVYYLLLNSGFPFGIGYISEVLIIYGTYEELRYFTFIIVISVLLCLIYTINILNRVVFGKVRLVKEENNINIEAQADLCLY